MLSPSSRGRDMRWKRHAYASLPSLQHCVVLRQDAAEASVFDRSAGWAERRVGGPEGLLALEAPDLALPLRALYANTGLL